ncbi:MAG: hypothetical protein GKR94_09415 [Gammaproteobacteria bacterium]|nr:hypothetical protein [Gammaproteobacteria bacterium]
MDNGLPGGQWATGWTMGYRVDNGLARAPYRQRVVSFPWPLRRRFAAQPKGLTRGLGVVTRARSAARLHRARVRRRDGARTGRVTVIERLGSTLNLNGHWPVLALEGTDTFEPGKARFHRASAPRPGEFEALPRTRITRLTRTRVRAGGRAGEEEQSCLDFDLNSPYAPSTRAAIGCVIAAGPRPGGPRCAYLTLGWPANPGPHWPSLSPPLALAARSTARWPVSQTSAPSSNGWAYTWPAAPSPGRA